MSKEILEVPKEYLAEVIKVIRLGLKADPKVDALVEYSLNKWCNKGEKYLKETES